MSCGVNEDRFATISRFRARLHEELQHELCLHKVMILDHAYQIAQDVERYHYLIVRRIEPIQSIPSGLRLGPSQTPIWRPQNPTRNPPVRKEEKGKSVLGEGPRVMRYFRCQEFGHVAA